MRLFWLSLALVSVLPAVAVLYFIVSWLAGLLYAIHTGDIFLSDWAQWIFVNRAWIIPLAIPAVLWRAKRVQNEFNWRVYPVF